MSVNDVGMNMMSFGAGRMTNCGTLSSLCVTLLPHPCHLPSTKHRPLATQVHLHLVMISLQLDMTSRLVVLYIAASALLRVSDVLSSNSSCLP